PPTDPPAPHQTVKRTNLACRPALRSSVAARKLRWPIKAATTSASAIAPSGQQALPLACLHTRSPRSLPSTDLRAPFGTPRNRSITPPPPTSLRPDRIAVPLWAFCSTLASAVPTIV